MITLEQNQLLDLLSKALFKKQAEPENIENYQPIYVEALAQSVLLLIYNDKNTDSEWQTKRNQIIINNMTNAYEHAELHELLSAHQIPYVILKGCASAAYYPDPMLRAMGDVDFLIKEDHMEMTGELLERAEFQPVEDRHGIHVAYHRGKSTWEMHRGINGIPGGAAGDRIRHYLSDMIETAVEYENEHGTMLIPDTLHHGLVLLLHTASHLTSEGVGLRHLCDWAVFTASMSNDEFVSMFEVPLKECGLWRFAQLLTLCCVKYLKMPERKWAGTAEDELLEQMICDIMNGGNFGKKDQDRYRQIKYISNRGEHTVDNKSPIAQAWNTIGKKAEAEEKSRLGVMLDYCGMVLRGERKLDNKDTLEQAKQRKQLYSEFKLFQL